MERLQIELLLFIPTDEQTGAPSAPVQLPTDHQQLQFSSPPITNSSSSGTSMVKWSKLKVLIRLCAVDA